MKNKIIFILITLWLVGSFVLGIIDAFLSSSAYRNVIPFAAFIGFISWIGLVLRKRWGEIIFGTYLFLRIFYTGQNLLTHSHTVYSVVVLIVLVCVGFPLIRYLDRNKGLTW